MDINKMTRKQFEALPYIYDMEDEKCFNTRDVDSIVLIPTRRHDSSGYNIFEVVACYHWKPIGKCNGYDTFSIYMDSHFNRVGIDCLRGSSLMRIFLPPDEYEIDALYHKIGRKNERKCI